MKRGLLLLFVSLFAVSALYAGDTDVLRRKYSQVSIGCNTFKHDGWKMKSDISRNTRIAESSRPFMCGLAPECHKCVPVIISDEGTVKPNEEKHEIEPNNED